MQPEYMHYNDVTVRLFGNFTVSAVNTKGLPKPDKDFKESGAFLTSLKINPPEVGGILIEGQRNNIGSSGSLSLVDYRNILYNKFIEFSKNTKNNGVCPQLDITVNCFTSQEVYKGFVKDWKLQFSGGAPTIEIEWEAYGNTENEDTSIYGLWRTPSKFLEMAKEKYSNNQKLDFIFEKAGKEDSNIDGILQFINGEANFDLSKVKSCGNKLVDAYMFLIQNSQTIGDDPKPITGEIKQDDPTKFIARVKDDHSNAHDTPNTKICSELIFIQNGKYAAYKTIKCSDGISRIVIPMTNFSFETDLANIQLQYDIIGNINGTVASGNIGGQTQLATNAAGGKAEAKSDAKSKPSASKISFDCYNVMAFDRNNPNSKIKFEVYNEFGEKHAVSGEATVTSVSYEISSAVIKATITATKEFNSSEEKDVPEVENTSKDSESSNANGAE